MSGFYFSYSSLFVNVLVSSGSAPRSSRVILWIYIHPLATSNSYVTALSACAATAFGDVLKCTTVIRDTDDT
jgi:hypothetical protein